jgi:RNA polymerase-binding transcription factor DksA
MAELQDPYLRDQLLQRRRRLETAVADFPERNDLVQLMERVDQALLRMDEGSYGLCETCRDDLESFRAGAPNSDDLTLMAIRRTA